MTFTTHVSCRLTGRHFTGGFMAGGGAFAGGGILAPPCSGGWGGGAPAGQHPSVLAAASLMASHLQAGQYHKVGAAGQHPCFAAAPAAV